VYGAGFIRTRVYASVVAPLELGCASGRPQTLPALLILGVLLCLWAAVVQYARRHGRTCFRKASPTGEIVNELPDRISTSLSLSAWPTAAVSSAGGYWGLHFRLLTAYVGRLARRSACSASSAADAKPWRMVVYTWARGLPLGYIWWGNGQIRYGGL